MTDEELAGAKVKELFDIIKETPWNKRIEVSWEDLAQMRLDAMKDGQKWENVVRLAILNYLQKNHFDIDPALPKEVIEFLRPLKLVI